MLRRRARHVITDSARARAIASALQGEGEVAARAGGGRRRGRGGGGARGEWGRGENGADTYRYVGTLLTEGHASLRDDFEVSWPQADAAVDAAIGAGAYGAKMIGGGFGGSVLALIPAGARSNGPFHYSLMTFTERGLGSAGIPRRGPLASGSPATGTTYGPSLVFWPP